MKHLCHPVCQRKGQLTESRAQCRSDGLVSRFERVLLPGFSVVTAKNDNLPLTSTQSSEVWNLQKDRRIETAWVGTQLDDSVKTTMN